MAFESGETGYWQMTKQSMLAVGAVLKHFGKITPRLWISAKLAMLQGVKWLLDNSHRLPYDRYAGKIKHVSFHITDLCNLSCITCGQRGKAGFQPCRNLKELKYNEVPTDLLPAQARP
jgi:hypothetical protein